MHEPFQYNYIGTVYGRGVYFTSDSSYAFGYCVGRNGCLAARQQFGNSEDGRHVESFQIYVVKVLVGEFTQGNAKMLTAPSRNDPKNPNRLFDSVVNSMENPHIFVIFQDHQCYPEYLITFKCIAETLQ